MDDAKDFWLRMNEESIEESVDEANSNYGTHFSLGWFNTTHTHSYSTWYGIFVIVDHHQHILLVHIHLDDEDNDTTGSQQLTTDFFPCCES